MRCAVPIFLLALLSTACNAAPGRNALAGTYTSNDGCVLEFKPSGKVYFSGCYAGSYAYDYEVDGDRIIIHESGNGIVYRMLPNGTIQGGGMEGILKKKP